MEDRVSPPWPCCWLLPFKPVQHLPPGAELVLPPFAKTSGAPQVPSVMCSHEKEELGWSESPAQPACSGHGSSAQYSVEVREVGM